MGIDVVTLRLTQASLLTRILRPKQSLVRQMPI